MVQIVGWLFTIDPWNKVGLPLCCVLSGGACSLRTLRCVTRKEVWPWGSRALVVLCDVAPTRSFRYGVPLGHTLISESTQMLWQRAMKHTVVSHTSVLTTILHSISIKMDNQIPKMSWLFDDFLFFISWIVQRWWPLVLLVTIFGYTVVTLKNDWWFTLATLPSLHMLCCFRWSPHLVRL